jgi:short-subunit dehydrogenase
MEEHLLAPIRRTAALVRHVRERGRGLVVHVVADPWEVQNAVVAGIHAGFAAFTESLRRELAEQNVRVVTIVARGEQPAPLAAAIASELAR